jgi:hypothetical protein
MFCIRKIILILSPHGVVMRKILTIGGSGRRARWTSLPEHVFANEFCARLFVTATASQAWLSPQHDGNATQLRTAPSRYLSRTQPQICGLRVNRQLDDREGINLHSPTSRNLYAQCHVASLMGARLLGPLAKGILHTQENQVARARRRG